MAKKIMREGEALLSEVAPKIEPKIDPKLQPGLQVKRGGPGAPRWISPFWECREGSTSTVVTVLNTSSADVQVKVTFYDEAGEVIAGQTRGATISPRATFFMRSEDRGVTERLSGWFEIAASGSVLPYAYMDDVAVFGPKTNRGSSAVRWALTLYPAE